MEIFPTLRRLAAEARPRRIPSPLNTPLRASGGPVSFSPLPECDPPFPRLECFSLRSTILPEPESRKISVYLPEAYFAEPSRRFPVLYLHDGQNLIDPRTSYIPGRTWRAAEVADRVIAEGQAEPIILVGVANSGIRRMDEYTPTRDGRRGGGDGTLYGQLLTEELKPRIDQAFRTLSGPADTGLGGSSLGGLISLFLGLQHPEIFGKLAVMSPSIWWDHRAVLSFVRKARPRPDLRIWLDIGTGEGQHHVRDTELLYRILLQQGWRDEQDLKLQIVPNAIHDEDAWASRLDQVLTFLFPRGAEECSAEA